MTVKECYELLNGNYQDALNRLMNDRLIEKFMLKFPDDDTMNQLRKSLEEKDYDTAFRNVHTLKGVAANLAFTALYTASSNLTEALRNNRTEPDAALVQALEDNYAHVISVLNQYKDAK